MTMRRELHRFLILAPAVFCVLGSYSAPLHGQTLIEGPLGNTTEPTMSLFILDMPPGRSAPTHTHEGVVFAYVLAGEIENQVDPDPLRVYRAGDFFHERPKQVHRVFRNASKTEAAKILVFQNTAALPPGVKPLLQQPLADLTNQEVSVIKIIRDPGSVSSAHQHPGPVFAYLLKGEVESQVDPDPPKVYRAGDVFYEPPMHVHRFYRVLSKTEPAELLVFFVHKMGVPFAVRLSQ
jgi:quercetin dioxygenase-like cupin family protein